MTPLILALLFVVAGIGITIALRSVQHRRDETRRQRLDFIRDYRFPLVLENRLADALPALDRGQQDQVLEHLRVWFLILAARPREPFGMPSKAVDIAWHEFILLTREYTAFCERAFGRYLHHEPDGRGRAAEEAAKARLGSTWLAARDPAVIATLTGLGLSGALAAGLFDLDRHLGLAHGFVHTPADIDAYVSAHHARASSGGDGGSGGADTGRADADGHGGDGGGDGGGGCGGGCGGA